MDVRTLFATAALVVALNAVAQPVEITIANGGVDVAALVFGRSAEHTVIALHGAGQSKNLFRVIAPQLARQGFRVIAIDWRAGPAGPEPGIAPLASAIGFARQSGAKKISLMGFSRGGELAARYASAQPDGEFDSLVLLSSYDDQGIPLERTKKLFVFHVDDRFGRWSQVSADKSSEPKRVVALKGGAHSIVTLMEDKPDLVDEIGALLRH